MNKFCFQILSNFLGSLQYLRRSFFMRRTRESYRLFPSSSRSGAPPRRAERYVIVTFQQPTGGLRRRKVRSAPLPPYGESFFRSLAPPFRPRSASLGSRPRRGQRSARMTANSKSARRYLSATNGGILRSLTLPLNDVQEPEVRSRARR